MTGITSAFGLLAKGGPVMIPLMICSVVSVAVLIERYLLIRKAKTDVSNVLGSAEDAIYSNNLKKAANLLNSQDSPIARVLAAGIESYHLGERGVERAMERQGSKETAVLTQRLGYLDTIITIAPLLGLLGTVTGMISAFHVIAAKQGISTPTAITGGVAEALIATATGLAIAIFTLIGYNAIQESIKHIVTDIEVKGTALTNVLADIGERSDEVKMLSA